MKVTHAPRIWQAQHLQPFVDALRQHATAHTTESATADDRRTADAALYHASGSPFGPSPLARWVWLHFEQWSTTN